MPTFKISYEVILCDSACLCLILTNSKVCLKSCLSRYDSFDIFYILCFSVPQSLFYPCFKFLSNNLAPFFKKQKTKK